MKSLAWKFLLISCTHFSHMPHISLGMSEISMMCSLGTHVCPGRKSVPYKQHPLIYISAQHWKLGKRRSIHRQRIFPVIKNPVSNFIKLITMVISHSCRFASRCHCGILFSSLKKFLKETCQGQRFLLVVELPALQPSGVAEREMNRQPPRALVPGFPYGEPDANGRGGKALAPHRASSNTVLQWGKKAC